MLPLLFLMLAMLHKSGCSGLRREDGYRLDPDRLRARLERGYDLVVLVNPNSPTGRHVGRHALEEVLRGAPSRTRFWIDETYIEYAGLGQSLEPFASVSETRLPTAS